MQKTGMLALGLLVVLAAAPVLAQGQAQGRQQPPLPPSQLSPAPPGQPPRGDARGSGQQESALSRRPDQRNWDAEHWRHSPGWYPGWRPYAWGPPAGHDPYYPYYNPYAPPAPVWVPGQWIWNGWQWVWQPGYWRY